MNPWPFVGLSIVGTIGSVVGLRGFLEVMTGHADEDVPDHAERWHWARELLFPYGLLTLVFCLVGLVGDIALIHYFMSQ
jgi:hypothetical protein